jgi:hypothetical protein
VLDAPASNTDGFLSRDTCVSSTHLNRPFRNKMRLFHLEITEVQEVLHPKTNS